MITPTICPVCNKSKLPLYGYDYLEFKCSGHYMFAGYLAIKDFIEAANFDNISIQNRYYIANNVHYYYSKVYTGNSVIDLVFPTYPQKSIQIFESPNYIPISRASIKRFLNLNAFI